MVDAVVLALVGRSTRLPQLTYVHLLDLQEHIYKSRRVCVYRSLRRARKLYVHVNELKFLLTPLFTVYANSLLARFAHTLPVMTARGTVRVLSSSSV